jgi:hypothetical protein
MQFLRRNQYFFLTVSVLALASVLVVRQYLANQSAHIQGVENFIVLWESGDTKQGERLYQLLVQDLPQVTEQTLVSDLHRTRLVLDSTTPQPENLIWKYHVSVNNELRRRAQQRLRSLQLTEHPQR